MSRIVSCSSIWWLSCIRGLYFIHIRLLLKYLIAASARCNPGQYLAPRIGICLYIRVGSERFSILRKKERRFELSVELAFYLSADKWWKTSGGCLGSAAQFEDSRRFSNEHTCSLLPGYKNHTRFRWGNAICCSYSLLMAGTRLVSLCFTLRCITTVLNPELSVYISSTKSLVIRFHYSSLSCDHFRE